MIEKTIRQPIWGKINCMEQELVCGTTAMRELVCQNPPYRYKNQIENC